METVRLVTLFAVTLALIVMGQLPARASAITGSVSLDTSSLSGPLELAFVFTDGNGSGDANNTVTLTDFAFGTGGSAGTVDTGLSTGGESGDLISGVTLVDSSFLNIFASTFTPGNLVSFDFGLTTNVDAGGTPDQLSLVLLQAGNPVATEDPSGADSLLTVNIDSANPSFGTFASDLTPAPIVTVFGAVPEPPTVWLLSVALVLWSVRTVRLPHRSSRVRPFLPAGE